MSLQQEKIESEREMWTLEKSERSFAMISRLCLRKTGITVLSASYRAVVLNQEVYDHIERKLECSVVKDGVKGKSRAFGKSDWVAILEHFSRIGDKEKIGADI